jgi:hypothetical protein
VEALGAGGAVVAARELESGTLAVDQDTPVIVVLVREQSPCSSATPTGCCTSATNTNDGPQKTLRELNVGFKACGAVGAACVACDLVRSNVCDQGQCLCGKGPLCAPGVACVADACVCPLQCAGCCDAAGNCQSPSAAACGAGGNSCQACGGGAACSAAGTCATAACTNCAGDTCCSGQGCVPLGNFPHCRAPGSRACAVCDLARSDACDSATTCRCGNQGPCAENQVCAQKQCVPLVR